MVKVVETPHGIKFDDTTNRMSADGVEAPNGGQSPNHGYSEQLESLESAMLESKQNHHQLHGGPSKQQLVEGHGHSFQGGERHQMVSLLLAPAQSRTRISHGGSHPTHHYPHPLVEN